MQATGTVAATRAAVAQVAARRRTRSSRSRPSSTTSDGGSAGGSRRRPSTTRLAGQRRALRRQFGAGGRAAAGGVRRVGPPGAVPRQRPADPALAQPARLANRLAAITDPAALAEELYLERPHATADARRARRGRPAPRRRSRRPSGSRRSTSWPGRCWPRPNSGSTTDALADLRHPTEARRRCDAAYCLQFGRSRCRVAASSARVAAGLGPGVGLRSRSSGRRRRPSWPRSRGRCWSSGWPAAPASSRPGTPSRRPRPAARSGRSRPPCPASGSPSCCPRPPGRCTGWPSFAASTPTRTITARAST